MIAVTHWTEDAFVENADLFALDLAARVEDADGEVADLLGLLADHDLEPESVLDVACGIGRHTVELAERGVEATGVDLSPEYVERAGERAAAAGVDDRTTFLAGDVRDLPVDGEFDLVTNLWTAFGYYDDETNRAVLDGVRDRVAPGGALLVELANKEGVLADFDPDGVAEMDDHRVVETREYDPATSRIRSHRRVYDADTDGFLGEYDVDLRAYAPVELRRHCEQAGFADVSLYGSLDGAELERASRRLVVVAEP